MKTDWKKVKLGELCEYVTSGGTPLASREDYYNPPLIPWLKTKEVNYTRITKTENFISQKGLDNSSAKLIPENSVIIAMYGQGDTAGRVSINKIPLATNQACCNFIIDKQKADYNYIYYQLCTMYDKMVSLKSGGAQPNLNAGKLKELEISLPSLSTQQKIASILSAYDDLIENNRKQIKLLEEAAQRLYKEWFVDLRFPGYENVAIVDGVPDGWRKVKVCDVIKTLPKTKQIKTADTLSQGKIPVIDQSREFIVGYTNDIETLIKSETPIIVFGDHTRILKLIQFPFARGADGTQVFISKNDCIKEYQLYCALKQVDLSNYSYARHFKYLKEIELLVATKNIAEQFELNATEIFKSVQCLRNKIQLLQQARDKLLPRLMSGDMEV